MRCPACGAYRSLEDSFCQRCAAAQPNSRLPVRRATPQPPAVWHQAAPALTRGAVLIAAGVAVEWILRSATKKLLDMTLSGNGRSRESKALVGRGGGAIPNGGIAVSETVVMRRVILRR